MKVMIHMVTTINEGSLNVVI